MYRSLAAFMLAATAQLASATDNTSPNLGPGSVLPGGWSYYGCYSDSISDRALTSDKYTDNTGMSQGACMVYCGSKGYTFAGIEYGTECYCGFGLKSSSSKGPDSDCNFECPGAQGTGDACGGQDHLSVFTTGGSGGSNKPVVNDYCYAGCYVDSVDKRILYEAKSDGPSMTVEVCTSTCKAAGFAFAGLENASQCFCGTTLLAGAQQALGSAVDSGCNMLCAGDKTEWCGGADRLTLYSTDKCGVKPSSAAPSSAAPSSSKAVQSPPPSTFQTSTKSSAQPPKSSAPASSAQPPKSSAPVSSAQPPKSSALASSSKSSSAPAGKPSDPPKGGDNNWPGKPSDPPKGGDNNWPGKPSDPPKGGDNNWPGKGDDNNWGNDDDDDDDKWGNKGQIIGAVKTKVTNLLTVIFGSLFGKKSSSWGW